MGSGNGAAVFEARALTKVYHVGEVAVHALRSVDFDPTLVAKLHLKPPRTK